MEEINLKNKHHSIVSIFNEIVNIFGYDYFDSYLDNEKKYIVDFWEDDLYAFGLKRAEKVAYISTWDFKDLENEKMKYYLELEIIDIESLEEVTRIHEVSNLSTKELLSFLISFWNNQPI